MQPWRVANNAAPAPGTSWVLLLSLQITPHPCRTDSCLSASPLHPSGPVAHHIMVHHSQTHAALTGRVPTWAGSHSSYALWDKTKPEMISLWQMKFLIINSKILANNLISLVRLVVNAFRVESFCG